jgi:aquaporin Z
VRKYVTEFVGGAGAVAGGGLSGGAFNPTAGTGPNLANMMLHGGAIGHVWLYIVGPLVGGTGAAFVLAIQNPSD